MNAVLAFIANGGQGIVVIQANRGFATSRLWCSDEDGTILVHTILHGSDWYIKKGGNALRAADKKSM